MHWIAPLEKDTAATLEKRRGDSADQFRATSGLKGHECSGPILGISDYHDASDVRSSEQELRFQLVP